MTQYFDALDTRPPGERERDLFRRLPAVVAAAMRSETYAERFGAIDPSAIATRDALSTLPVLRKSDLPDLQRKRPPFGGLSSQHPGRFARLFTSPGPIYEAQGLSADVWGVARPMHAMGFRAGEIMLNTFSYHLVPAGFIMDAGARELGCAVIPAGPGNTQQQLDLIAAFRPTIYCGTPDFLKIILDAPTSGRDVSSIERALVSGAAFPKNLQDDIARRGIEAFQAYATADIGIIAYETPARDGMIVNENIIVEIVRPGTGDPVAEGEVGEIVVTTLDETYPLIRFALGDLTAAIPGISACGRTNMRIKGWMGRADQTTKVKGMFVRPEQIDSIGKRHPELLKLRLVVTRSHDADAMTLACEADRPEEDLAPRIAETLQMVTKLRGAVEIVPPGSLPNDGKVIADERTLT
ncbi:phenylacetate--CoA ligase family protein [Microvirga brassicacearum]|uniref:Phenylacetate--CoA ligase n=1 Tax=Microvirga brassicacearum TaxID=2580413 RepID=A0A5N3PBF3_9HYPH|nr:AMP-binding protein [Microvirga brassicacearum]KAB0267078.1 phenylacetate--CoA ligase [Microvirga brassicacearum]